MGTDSVWFGGRLVQKGGTSVAAPDRLGSIGRYLPYGEERTGQSGNPANGNEKFATYTRDGVTGLDYADQRWYAQGQGRFLTSDPYQASAGPSDPASWNRYAYVQGDPVGAFDPNGLASADAWGDEFLCMLRIPHTWFSWGVDSWYALACRSTEYRYEPTRAGDEQNGSESQRRSRAPASLVERSRQRARKMLENPRCANAIGAGSSDIAIAALERADISLGPTMYGRPSSDNGGGITFNLGQYFRGDAGEAIIRLNERINWLVPNRQSYSRYSLAVDDDGNIVRSLIGEGVTNLITAIGLDLTHAGVMDLAVLHELAHHFGLSHPDGDVKTFNEAIYNACFRN
jgi:RHS repeat-associated protein